MTRHKHFYSINFILWIAFLVFAAFIILLTWVFQTTLLQVFFNAQTEEDVQTIGNDLVAFLGRHTPVTDSDREIDMYIYQKQTDNPAARIFLLDEEGNVLYPLPQEDSAQYDPEAAPTKEEFDAALEVLRGLPEGSQGVPGLAYSMKRSDGNYLYFARISSSGTAMSLPDGGEVSAGVLSVSCGEEGAGAAVRAAGALPLSMDEGAAGALSVSLRAASSDDVYLYVEYSTELAGLAMGTMRVQLVLISVIVIFLALVISALLSMWLTRPVQRITKAAKRMAAGDFTVNFKGEYSYAEMDALAETLDYAKEEIGKSDQLQKEVLANVTHDLKTPLTMIKAYASMIQEISGDNPEKRAKHTQVIIDESDRLTALVNDILNISKIRSGMDTLKLRQFDLSELVHTVLERFDYLTEMQGYTIVREIDDELYTEADLEKVEQVIYNLVGNAVNYTGEDKRIVVGLRKEGNVIRFTVADTGKGIPPEEQATIWDRYYRSSEMHKRPIRGTGLGLSIVKTILQKHGFKFGVESEVGAGSTFYVLFPAR
ncbi:MAG TPA: HAMP domain-containing histidine kinase [Candidatus Borkfalkia faecavium]|uniref:histidine kinase n=1 Tax=Candidatus Borkfalkia faecavium TaxID=2838508 RepID=A0A9D2AU69_9FIRM|nr:HAMP domain-containing histidine kinase [Candidatus Borkfalkia faecavium]